MEALGPNAPADTDASTPEWLRSGMGFDRNEDARATLCAVLHLVRDRLPSAYGMALGARLPPLIRGMYYGNWKPQAERIPARHAEEFLGLLERDLRVRGLRIDPQHALDAVARCLRSHLEPADFAALMRALPPGLSLLLADPRG